MRKTVPRVPRRPVHRPRGGPDLLRGARDRSRRCWRSCRCSGVVGAGRADRRRRSWTSSTSSSPATRVGDHRAGRRAARRSRPRPVSRSSSASLIALWSASGYVGAFGRAMNRIYEIDEGRPFWKLRPVMLLVTLVTVVLVALVALMLVVVRAGGQRDRRRASGWATAALTVWNIAKWPVIVLVVVLVVAILYYATPNVKQPKFRWISVGAVRRDPRVGPRLGGLRVLRRELLQLRQDLRLARRRHRLPAVAVDHQPRAAVRRRARRRDRARSPAAGRHPRRRRPSSCRRATRRRA